MPGRGGLAFGALCLLTGCAALGTGRQGLEPPTLEELFPAPPGPSVAAEGNVTLSMAGRRASLAGAVLLSAPSSFRVDLLDPLDRPAAIVFGEGERVVQFVPSALAAARLSPFPGQCTGIPAGAWVPYAAGAGPPAGQRGDFRALRWLGGLSFQRWESGEIREQIDCGVDAGSWFAERVTWFCGGDPVLRLELEPPDRREGGEGRLLFSVRFPAPGLTMGFDLRAVNREAAPPPDLLRPPLPQGTRWTSFDLVQGR